MSRDYPSAPDMRDFAPGPQSQRNTVLNLYSTYILTNDDLVIIFVKNLKKQMKMRHL